MGEVFAGRYELLDPIATGGMGSIWRVLDRQDAQVKVAKILRQSDAASLLRFVREQSVRIDHSHVVTPLSWAGMDDRVLFTMPLVRGGSVADLLREHGALPPRWVAVLTDQLLQALEAVHGAGFVHRDVKPANLLLDPTGPGPATLPRLRLTDFGIAAPVDAPRMTRASVAIGTPGYMPPEQWRGADPDPRADLYSVGRVAHEMLTGRRPGAAVARPGHGHGSAPAGADAPTERDAARPGTPVAELLRLVEHACADAVDDRPASAAAMRAALAATGLLSAPPDPGEAIVVPDRFGAPPTSASAPPPAPPPPPTVAQQTLRAPALPPPPPPRDPAPAPTRVGPDGRTVPLAASTARPGGARRASSPVAAVVLVVAGLVGLVVAAVLVLGA